MTFSTLKNHLRALPCGKKLNHSLYITEESLEIADKKLYAFTADLKTRVNAGSEYNVIKFFTNEFKISWLSYPDFFTDPHPSLKQSLTLNIATGKTRKFNYYKSVNSPILHRKETFLHPEHHLIESYSELTKEEELYGLYSNTKTIGFKLNWEMLLNEKGLSYKGHKLIQSQIPDNIKTAVIPVIDRHKTAISRYNFSKPVQKIMEHNLLSEKESFFDYGCGLGDDLRGLASLGYRCSGWDPVHKQDGKKIKADVVNVGFVLNVIEDTLNTSAIPVGPGVISYNLEGESEGCESRPQIPGSKPAYPCSLNRFRPSTGLHGRFFHHPFFMLRIVQINPIALYSQIYLLSNSKIRISKYENNLFGQIKYFFSLAV